MLDLKARIEPALVRAAQVEPHVERSNKGAAIEVLDCIALAHEVLRLRDLLRPKRHPMEGGMVSGGAAADMTLIPMNESREVFRT